MKSCTCIQPLLFLLVILTIKINAQTATMSEIQLALTTQLSNFIQKNHYPGAVLSIDTPNNGTIDFGVGLGNLQTNEPMYAQAFFRVASISKVYLSAGILLLEQNGKLSLDDTMDKWITTITVPKSNQITIFMLCHMMSGLWDYEEALNETDYAVGTQTPESLLQLAASKPFDFEPGTAYKYSNTNTLVLGMIIAKASGKSLHDFFTDFFQQFGLTESVYPSSYYLPDPHNEGYSDLSWIDNIQNLLPQQWFLAPNTTYVDTTYYNYKIIAGNGEIIATAQDLRKFGKMLFTGQIYNNNVTLNKLLDFVKTNVTSDQWYAQGAGVEKYKTDCGDLIGKTGQLNGFETLLLFDQQTQITQVYYINYQELKYDPYFNEGLNLFCTFKSMLLQAYLNKFSILLALLLTIIFIILK